MKYIIFLLDGMADDKLEELENKTPLEAAVTNNLDNLAKEATFGTFLTLPDEFPTSSDVANMSVLGWDLASSYTGRGAIESYGAGVEMKEDTVAFRMNLITIKDGEVEDYSAGQLDPNDAKELIEYLNEKLGDEFVEIKSGVSYRNLLYLRGDRFSADIDYDKPDSSHGMKWEEILPVAKHEGALETERLLRDLMYRSKELLEEHPINKRRVEEGKKPANIIWPWSGGKKPVMPSFKDMYNKKGAIVSAVDVILGLGTLGKMDTEKPEGATGFIDTNYENKAKAAIELLKKNDFIYIHLEGIDECGHMGDLDKKLHAIEDADRRLIGTFLDEYKKHFNEEYRIMVLPDHPVPVKLRKHTREKVPFMLMGKNVKSDKKIGIYSEENCRKGKYTDLKGRELIDLLFQNKVD